MLILNKLFTSHTYIADDEGNTYASHTYITDGSLVCLILR